MTSRKRTQHSIYLLKCPTNQTNWLATNLSAEHVMQCTLIQAGFYQSALFCVHLTQHRYSTGQTAYRFLPTLSSKSTNLTISYSKIMFIGQTSVWVTYRWGWLPYENCKFTTDKAWYGKCNKLQSRVIIPPIKMHHYSHLAKKPTVHSTYTSTNEPG